MWGESGSYVSPDGLWEHIPAYTGIEPLTSKGETP